MKKKYIALNKLYEVENFIKEERKSLEEKLDNNKIKKTDYNRIKKMIDAVEIKLSNVIEEFSEYEV